MLAYSQVSDLKFGIERVPHDRNAMTEALRSVEQSLDQQTSSIVDYAIRQVRVEDRIKVIEKRLEAVERGVTGQRNTSNERRSSTGWTGRPRCPGRC